MSIEPQERRPAGGRLPVRKLRIWDKTWKEALTRAHADRVTRGNAIALLVKAYGQGLIDLPEPRVHRRVKGVYPGGKAIRVDTIDWETARRRALSEGHKVSNAVALLVDGYARGALKLPVTRLVMPEE